MNDGAAFAIALVAGLAVGFFLGASVAATSVADTWRGKLCEERLSHAATPRDTLTIYSSDKTCVVERTS